MPTFVQNNLQQSLLLHLITFSPPVLYIVDWLLHVSDASYAGRQLCILVCRKFSEVNAVHCILTSISISYKSDNYCCLGRARYGIRWYSTRYVRPQTITHVGTVQQTLGRYYVGMVQKSGRYMILACTLPPGCRLVVRVLPSLYEYLPHVSFLHLSLTHLSEVRIYMFVRRKKLIKNPFGKFYINLFVTCTMHILPFVSVYLFCHLSKYFMHTIMLLNHVDFPICFLCFNFSCIFWCTSYVYLYVTQFFYRSNYLLGYHII